MPTLPADASDEEAVTRPEWLEEVSVEPVEQMTLSAALLSYGAQPIDAG